MEKAPPTNSIPSYSSLAPSEILSKQLGVLKTSINVKLYCVQNTSGVPVLNIQVMGKGVIENLKLLLEHWINRKALQKLRKGIADKNDPKCHRMILTIQVQLTTSIVRQC